MFSSKKEHISSPNILQERERDRERETERERQRMRDPNKNKYLINVS